MDLASLAYKMEKNRSNMNLLRESSQKSLYLAKSKSHSKNGMNSGSSVHINQADLAILEGMHDLDNPDNHRGHLHQTKSHSKCSSGSKSDLEDPS